MTTLPSTASTLGSSWSWRLPRAIGSGGDVWPPACLAPDDVPRGKILVVEDEAVVALDLQRTLREAGYRVVGPAASLTDVQKLIARGSIDCAVLDLAIDRRAPIPVADLLAFAEVPFVFLTDGDKSGLPLQHAHRPLVQRPYADHDLLAAIERAMRRHGRPGRARSLQVPPTVPFPRVFPQL
jgi:DNA-binding response OmpR family regulator